MSREEWQRIKRIVGDARDKPPEQRNAFLVAACAGDERLRREVDALIVATEAAERLFDTPVVSIDGAPAFVNDVLPQVPTLAGTLIGSYRVIRELGRGGMGSVYLASRADGVFDQQVAIKLLGNVASEELLTRFWMERRILATLEHPNIARLLDGGTTPAGVPFLSMEYVDGAAIDEFCEARAIGLPARLELFRRVCAAVHYAHQRLVIHRDIKASNILVTADGTPKLLDFGIAKMLAPIDRPASATVVRLLTPESASPEQVRGEPITIAADVYALGVLLYRMLSGRSPYGSAARSEAELFRAICEDTPVGPLVERARAGLAPWRAGTFARDLDRIVLKALRKEPDRRYSSVEQLSDDVDRFLQRRPVLAGPDSRIYRARTFLARHRISAAVTLLASAAVLAGAGIAAQQAAVASRERLRAEQRFNDVRTMANALVFELHDAVADLPGSLDARRLLVKRAADYLDGLARDAHSHESALQRELASANVRLGDIMGGGGISNLGDIPGAEDRYRMAVGLLERLVARQPAEVADIEGLAQVRIQVSRLLIAKGDLAAAERSAREAIELLADGTLGGQVDAARAYHTLGYVQARQGSDRAALESLAEATLRARQQLDEAPEDSAAIARFSRIAGDYAHQLHRAGRGAESLGVLREARVHLEALIARDPLNTRHRFNLAYLLNTEGTAFSGTQEYQAASVAFAAALKTVEMLRAESPNDQEARFGTMVSRYWYAMSLIRTGDSVAGLRLLRQAIGEAEDIVARSPDNAAAVNQLSAARVELGATLLAINADSREGCNILGQGLEGWRELEVRAQLPGDSGRNRATFERQWQRCRN